jgi:SAM-dependent methyltransferase
MASAKVAPRIDEAPLAANGGGCRLCGSSSKLRIVLENGRTNLVKCEACSVGFVDPPYSADSMATHFKDEYIQDDTRLEKVYGDLRSAALTLIATQVLRKKQRGRILDVGCAGGYFLDRYFRSVKWEKFGVEPSRYALERMARRGIQAYEGDLLSVQLPSQWFDVITAAGVLPYFREPARELQIIRRALKPDGLFVVELPLGATQIWRHTTALGKLTGGGSRSVFNSPHLYFYDLKSIRYLLRDNGFEVEDFHPSPGNQQANAFMNLLFRGYYEGSCVLSALSRGRVMMGPGLVVAAVAGG